MGILSSRWTKFKIEPGYAWFNAALGFASVGMILVFTLRYLGEDRYYELFLAEFGLTGGAGICLWIWIWKVYQNRQMRHRKRNLWLGTLSTLVATATTLFYWYRFNQHIQ